MVFRSLGFPGLSEPDSVLGITEEPHKRKYVVLLICLDFRQLLCFLGHDLITESNIPLSDFTREA